MQNGVGGPTTVMNHVPTVFHLPGDKDGCHGAADRDSKSPVSGALIDAVFLAAALGTLILWANTPISRTMAVTYAAIVLEALPFMLIGSLTGGLVEVFVSNERMSRTFPKGRKGILLAAGLGLVFPVCECAIVPLIRRLLAKGVPPGAAMSFLLAGPIVNPVAFLSTGIAYSLDWSTAFLRVAFGYAIGISFGLLVDFFAPDSRRITIAGELTRLRCHNECPRPHDHRPAESVLAEPSTNKAERMWDAIGHGANDFLDTGRFLVMGAFVAALINAVLPRYLLAGLAGTPVLSIVSAMALAVALNLCSNADAFIASSMRSFLPFPAQMAFMLLGPMLDIKLLFMYRSVFRPRFIVLATIAVIASVMCAAVGLHLLSGGHHA